MKFSIPKKAFIVIIFSLNLTACSQHRRLNPISGVTIDPNIKYEVEKHIESSKDLDGFKGIMEAYLNSAIIESFENDSLVLSRNYEQQKKPFKSFYFWKGDTLSINGAFGLSVGIGFVIYIYNNNAVLYHLLSSDEIPAYSYKENDSVIFRLEVPCKDTKIILSEIPDSSQKQVIYGYVEFKSENYYVSNGSMEGKEILPRKKLRNIMKMYFKSSRLDSQIQNMFRK